MSQDARMSDGSEEGTPVVLGIDDLRSLPRATRIARTSHDGVLLLKEHRDHQIDELWLDHDLGGDDSIMPSRRGVGLRYGDDHRDGQMSAATEVSRVPEVGDKAFLQGIFAETAKGNPNRYCWVFVMRDGRIAEYTDTQLIAEVLAPPSEPQHLPR